MKKLFFLLSAFILTGIVNNARAQYVLLQDATGGNVVNTNGYVDVEGSPFLNTNWAQAILTLKSGRVLHNIDIKYDNVGDEVYVKGPKEELVLLNDRIVSFTYMDVDPYTFDSGYTNIPGCNANAYFEVLTKGKTRFLKKYVKTIQSDKPYNSAVSAKTFIETDKYYIVTPNAVIQIKKDKKSVLAALADKQPQLETYIKENNINFKSDNDIAKLISYYNTL